MKLLKPSLIAFFSAAIMVLGIHYRHVYQAETARSADAKKVLASHPWGDLEIRNDVAYAAGDRHSLDIYKLRGPSTPRPVIIFLYGGAWRSGSKEDVAWVGAALARRGYIAVMPDYRLYPETHWPHFLEDCAAAVRWTRDNIARFGGDPLALVLMGHSSGAYNAFSLAVDQRWLTGAGVDARKDIKAVIGLSGPYTMEPNGADEEAVFDIKSGRYSEPIEHADGTSPPMLLIIGDKDGAVEPANSDEVAKRIQTLGGITAVIHYPALGHGETVDALASPPGGTPPIMDDIERFLSAHGVASPRCCSP